MAPIGSELGLRLGVDLGGTTIRAVLLGHGVAPLSEVLVPTLDHAQPDVVLDRVAHAARRAVGMAGAGLDALRSVGVGLPGEVEPDRGLFRSSPIFPTWRDLPVAGALADRLKTPVQVENDANATLLAELRLGAAQGADPALLVTLGTGIGGAVAVGGRLLRGWMGSAGEVGHLPVDPSGPPCGCGARGCLGVMASTTALIREFKAHKGLSDSAEVDGEHVARAHRAGDPAARRALDGVLDALAVGLASASVVLAPRRIVLFGGIMAGLGDALVQGVRARLARRPYPAAIASMEVVPATLGPAAGAIGAALLPRATARRRP